MSYFRKTPPVAKPPEKPNCIKPILTPGGDYGKELICRPLESRVKELMKYTSDSEEMEILLECYKKLEKIHNDPDRIKKKINGLYLVQLKEGEHIE